MLFLLTGAFFLFRKVSNDVVAALVEFAHDVEEERIRVVIERFVIEEELRKKAEILRVLLQDYKSLRCS